MPTHTRSRSRSDVAEYRKPTTSRRESSDHKKESKSSHRRRESSSRDRSEESDRRKKHHRSLRKDDEGSPHLEKKRKNQLLNFLGSSKSETIVNPEVVAKLVAKEPGDFSNFPDISLAT